MSRVISRQTLGAQASGLDNLSQHRSGLPWPISMRTPRRFAGLPVRLTRISAADHAAGTSQPVEISQRCPSVPQGQFPPHTYTVTNPPYQQPVPADPER